MQIIPYLDSNILAVNSVRLLSGRAAFSEIRSNIHKKHIVDR